MKDSAKIWYSIRRGTLRIALVAFAACAAATVPANVVRNDLVTATSDAELETSDKGMGLGINVVGGGDAVITLETRPGWRFRDGSTTFTMNKLAGVKATSPEIVNEGSTPEDNGEIVADDGGVTHVLPKVEIRTNAVPEIAAYALPANSATVAFELSASVKSDAEHWETDKNGNKTKGPETFSPDEYVWKAVASNTVTAACVEWSTTSSGKGVTGALQLGKGAWKVTFSVYAKATCSTCNETVESAEDDEVRTVTVYEVSINRPDYLGLDQTDAGRKGHTVTNATIVTDPKYVGLDDNAVTWTACGEFCEFKDENGVAKSKGEKVNYRNKGADNASKSLNAEPLTTKVSIPGAEDVYCTNNFTVVKVDVKIGEVGEDKEESEGAFIPYVADTNGVISVEGTNKLVAVSFTCEPELPGDEMVTVSHSGSGELYERLPNNELVKVTSTSYSVRELAKRAFVLHGHQVSPNLTNGVITVEHGNSEAKDVAKYTVVKLCVTNIKFNHDHSSSTADAINIRRSFAEDIDVSGGEWIDTGAAVKNEPFCYTTNRTVTIMARFEASDFITSAMISAICEGAKGSLSDVLETNVVFSGGVSSPEYVTFTLKDATLSQIDCARGGILKWLANGINGGSSSCEMNQSGPHTVYTIFGEPRPPWKNAYGEQENAWTNALEFAIVKAGAAGKNKDKDALAAVTTYLHSGHGLTYDTRLGTSHYNDANIPSCFNLTGYMAPLTNIVNCHDQAHALSVAGKLLGIDSKYAFMMPFGYINPVSLVGEGVCNNPFYPGCNKEKLTGGDILFPHRAPFSNHGFVSLRGEIFDACAGPVLGTGLQTYITSTIDISSPDELRIAGTMKNVGVEGETIELREIKDDNGRLVLGSPMRCVVPSVNSIK